MKWELERDVEADIRKLAIRLGWLCWKFVSPGLRGVPDRIFIKAGRVIFIEVKRPGEEPNEQQAKRHDELRAAGCEVHWVSSVREARVILSR